METPEVPVGSLIDFGPEAPTSSPLEAPPPVLQDGDGSLGDGASESETTESADSENDIGESPSHPSWDQDRRSSSNESFSSNQSTESTQDEETLALRDFMRGYVEKIFSGGEDLDQEEKAKFGEYCSSENGKGREWFARYVSAQRCNSKCVSEATFYRLVQSFAVVLFECHQMDDFGPAKNLMTMCFTYYHIGKPQLLPPESREKPAGSIDSYLKSANSWLAEKKDIAERLLKNTSARTENVKGFFGGLETKLKGPLARRNEEDENKPQEKRPRAVTVYSPEDEKKGEKIYLYTHLKQQPIWHTLRFWNAAFFDAVHCERTKRSPTTSFCCRSRGDAGEEEEKREKWCHMTQEERDDSLRFNENITFGQLGTFTHNMLAFGLNKKLCNDFLKKQAVIGNLDEEQYKLLSDHIEQMATE
uniref:KIAA0513 n=3 Tax=Pan TaxID=9596 RepID=K7BIJ9_PANTR